MTKSGKHCGKRRNCTSCAIFSFVTMFSKSCLLQRRQKGLREWEETAKVYLHLTTSWAIQPNRANSFNSFSYLLALFPYTTNLQQTKNIYWNMYGKSLILFVYLLKKSWNFVGKGEVARFIKCVCCKCVYRWVRV